MWWLQAEWKGPPDWGCGAAGDSGLCDWLGREIASPLIPAYGEFLSGFVVPNLAWTGAIIWASEVFIAVSLILGLFTRLGAMIGTIISVNLLVGLWAVPHEWYWTYVFLIFVNFFFVLTRAGRWLGLDALIVSRLSPSSPLRWLV